MSKYLHRLLDIVVYANSKKVTDKRKCITELQEIYENQEAVEEIHENSRNKVPGRVDWNIIMHSVHKVLLFEVEKSVSKAASSRGSEKKRISAFMLTTIGKANSSAGIFLKCSDLVSLLLQILDSKTYEDLHKTYMYILVKHVLPVRNYWSDMSTGHWQELLKICMKSYENPATDLNKSLILDALEKVAQHGCLHSHLGLSVKKIFPFLVRVFHDAKSDPKELAEAAFKVAITVYQNIGAESRMAFCTFSETVLQTVIALNGTPEKYEFLLLMVQAHHPEGATMGYGAAHACNWDIWKTILRSMYSMIIRDGRTDMISESFVNLGCEVSRQLAEDNNSPIELTSTYESRYSQPSKRRRISVGVQGATDMLSSTRTKDTRPTILILTALIKKYPECMKESDFEPLLEVLTNHLKACNDREVMDCMYELSKVLVEVEGSLSSTFVKTETTKLFWDKIWDIALRSVSMNQNVESGHALLQSLIKQKKMVNSNAFLRLYFTNTVTWSPSSLRTLLVFCERAVILDSISPSDNDNYLAPNNTEPIKVRLLRWVLAIPHDKMNSEFPIEDVSKLLVGLTLKSWYRIKNDNTPTIRNTAGTIVPRTDSGFESRMSDNAQLSNLRLIEVSHMLTAFECTVNDNIVMESTQSDVKKGVNVMCVEEALNFLIKNMCEVTTEIGSKNDTNLVIIQTALVAKVASNLIQMKILQGNIEEFGLTSVIKHSMERMCSTLMNRIDSLKRKHRSKDLLNIMNALNLLYKTVYSNDISELVVSSSTTEMLQSVFSLTDVGLFGRDNTRTVDEDDDEDDCMIGGSSSSESYIKDLSELSSRRKLMEKSSAAQEDNSWSNKDRVRFEAERALVSFCTINSRFLSNVQKSGLRRILKFENWDLTRLFDFKTAVSVLESTVMCKPAVLCEKTIDSSLTLLQQLCRNWYKSEEAARNILRILFHLIEHLKQDGNDIKRKNLLRALRGFRKNLQEKKYGPLVYMEFINCLQKIATLDHYSSWAIFDASTETDAETSVMEDLIIYIKSPFHMVRLEVVKCLYVLFSSKDPDFRWQNDFFLKLNNAVMSSFIVDGDLEEEEKADERITRTASALHAFVAVVSSSGIFRSQALLSMFQLVANKRINTEKAKKALCAIAKILQVENSSSIVEDNLDYLLSHWFNQKCPLTEFPWALAYSTSEEEFCRKYIHILVPLMIQNEELTNVMAFCGKLNLSFSETIEKCYPRIMSWFLPLVSANSSNPPRGSTNENIRKATEIFEHLKLNENVFQSARNKSHLLNDKLEEVVVSLIKRIHDKEHLKQLLNLDVHLPVPDLPHFEVEHIMSSFKYLEQKLLLTEKSLIHYLASEKQSVLQRVLLDLTCSLHAITSVEQKVKAFHHYMYFCMMIIHALKNEYFNEMSTYVIRDVCHTLIYLIKDDFDIISQLAFRYFYQVLEFILPERQKEFIPNLRFIVASLIPMMKSGNDNATSMLKFLIVEKRDVLGSAIQTLDPFPTDNIFDEMRHVQKNLKDQVGEVYTLRNEIIQFLELGNEESLSCSFEGVENLKKQLSMRKTELKAMYSELEELRGFSEDCASSPLHQLIIRLVKLTLSSDLAISLEAAKCLGELGPADLTTMILQPEKSDTMKETDSMQLLTYRIVVLLSDFLIKPDFRLVSASANVLYTVLASPWGRKLSTKRCLQEFEVIMRGKEPLMCIDYIQPFITSSIDKRTISVNKTNFKNCFDHKNLLWTGEQNRSHADWLMDITCNTLNCFCGSYLESLISVCKVNVSFCEVILPWIIDLLIRINPELSARLCLCINQFFERHFNSKNVTGQSLSPNAPQMSICFNHESVQCMLNVVNFIRLQSEDNFLLQLNYLYVAKAAQYCSAFFTSVLYAELWCETVLKERRGADNLSVIDYICDQEPEHGKVLQDILREACIKIGDPDAIYGCGSSQLQDRAAKIQQYVHLRKWDKVMLAYDVQLSHGSSTDTRGLLNALQHSGLQYLLGGFIQTASKTENINDIQYESAWRLSNWNALKAQCTQDLQEDDDLVQNITSDDYHLYHYKALKCLHESDANGLKTALDCARFSVIKSLRNASLESTKTVYPALSQLQMLREIEELGSANALEYDIMLNKWKAQDSINCHDFQCVEPILSQRAIMYQCKTALSNSPVIKEALIDTYLQIAEMAEKQGYLEAAVRALETLAKQTDLSDAVKGQLHYQEAMLAWMSNDQDIGRFLLRNLIYKSSPNPNLLPQALRVYGNWMADSKSENPQMIIERYYKNSISSSEKIHLRTPDDLKNLLETHAALAQFSHAQYEQIVTYMKSPQFESLKECVAYSHNAIMGLNLSSNDAAERRAAIMNQRQSNKDMVELENVDKEKNMYLLLALRHYLVTLEQGEEHNLLIFRLVSLWLDNMYHTELNAVLQTRLDKIATYKFVPLIPQLAPHMSNISDEFSTKIYNLLQKCAIAHPHHTLPVLLALKNLYKDYEFINSKKGPKDKPEPRVLGASKLIDQLSKTKKMHPIIQEMDKLAHSLIMLANTEITSKQRSPVHKIPNNQAILKIKNFKHTLVPTLTIDVKPSGNYDIIGVQEYDATFTCVGGLNAPKKITCIGTDGIRRNQLAKGKDDLRQDAVMQQVFTVMNSLLRTSKETKKRKLSIRTYKVIPLTQRSGVLEWCDNTMPVDIVLVGNDAESGIHGKYYPKDYSAKICKSKIKDVEKKSTDIKYKAFMDCCKNFHPVFHYFFLENFPSPAIWFERRLAYVRSVATTSIIGYILGLGDRHLRNVLIDKTTAELIHIDFGIAFEQGRVLPTPETVPFRVTRNIEVAMGVSGVEGVMRRSCEETMTVLREQREIIITLLQVLLYDPLFTWAISPAKAYNIQSGNTQQSSDGSQVAGEINKLAERALLRIDQKLRGTEEGSASSVAGQVERLIQQARDPTNLSRLYCGWQAYM